jgi:MFS family permease
MIPGLRDLNPWWVVFGSTLALVVCSGSVGVFTFGLFLKPISQEFGWDRGTMSAATRASVASLMIAIAVPATGMLVDRFGVRRVLLVGIAMAGVGVILVSQLTQFLIGACGWRGAYIGLGVVVLAVAFPAVAMLVHEPADVAWQPRVFQKGMALPPGLSVREALTGSPRFWLLGRRYFWSQQP